jgi:hypothetical protein
LALLQSVVSLKKKYLKIKNISSKLDWNGYWEVPQILTLLPLFAQRNMKKVKKVMDEEDLVVALLQVASFLYFLGLVDLS